MKTKAFLFVALMLLLAGCAELLNVLQSAAGTTLPLTEAEVANGLKEALTTGAKNAAQKLAVENGYYGDAALKIL